MQSSGGRRSAAQYVYRAQQTEVQDATTANPDEDAEGQAADDTQDDSGALKDPAAAGGNPETTASSSSRNALDVLTGHLTRAATAASDLVRRQPLVVVGSAVAALAAAGLVVALAGLTGGRVRRHRRPRAHAGRTGAQLPPRSQQQAADGKADGSEPPPATPLANGTSGHVAAAATRGAARSTSAGGDRAAKPKAAAGGKGSKAQASPATPGPNAKVKPSKDCVATADGSAVVVRRPIAADNSCLFNAVGYVMHHSHNRAPFLRRVVSNEVASDPQSYSSAFLGMSNPEYCAWINNPVNWGGGIELSILAAHYRREIAAWNVETGQVHVFGEERGFQKQVMVIYNGVHYDALAVSASPSTNPDDDLTEFNPRSKRGQAILAAARRLVELNRKGDHFVSPSKVKTAVSALASAAAVSAAPAGSVVAATSAAGAAAGMKLQCGDCGVGLVGEAAAKEHAAATGHTRFAQRA